MMAPNMPTPEERTRHDEDHMPYLAWCRSCVAGKGKADEHLLKKSHNSCVKGVACGYCFMGDAVEGGVMNERCLPVLVHKFHGDRWVTGRVVPRTGPEEHTVKHSGRPAAKKHVQISVQIRCKKRDKTSEAACSSRI